MEGRDRAGPKRASPFFRNRNESEVSRRASAVPQVMHGKPSISYYVLSKALINRKSSGPGNEQYLKFIQLRSKKKKLELTHFVRHSTIPNLDLDSEGEGKVAFFSAKRWDSRNRADLIESATPCHDAQVVGLYRDSNPLRLTVLAAVSEDYTTAPQNLQGKVQGWMDLCPVARQRIDHIRQVSYDT